MQALRSGTTSPPNLVSRQYVPEHEEHHENGESVREGESGEVEDDLPLFNLFQAPPENYAYDTGLFDEERNRVFLSLLALNFVLVGASGAASYFLAGRTLKPIEAMMNEQKRFVSDASHELRTPLTAMKTEVEVALRDKNLDPSEAREILESNLEEIDKLNALSDRLLALGRLQNPGKSIECGPISLSQAAEEAIQQVLPLAIKKNIEIEFEPVIAPHDTIEGQKNNIVDMLVIFLDNAIKYSRDGSRVILKMVSRKTHMEIVIQDFGYGIKPDDLPNIFNRFYRADISRSAGEIDGYGLGLSIAKEIIEKHEGDVRVESEVERGTRFTVTLPRKHLGQDGSGKITIRIV
ncbi:MAG: HAMP domain-containing histidine kinase [Rubrobacteridae bacterium]|nr:HAMP domain-containing histidine kinase [Rubrobacteridae bacterium]